MLCELLWSLHHGDQTRYCDRKTSSNSQQAKHNNRVPVMPDILVKDFFFLHNLFVAVLSYPTSEHSGELNDPCSWWSSARLAAPPRELEGIQGGAAGSLSF